MAFTPFHLGPALLLGLLAWKHLDFPTLLFASVLTDFRAAAVFSGFLDGSPHGIVHTFIGGAALAFLIIGIITPFRQNLELLMDRYGFSQSHNDGTVVAAAFTGVSLHIFLDSFLYIDIEPFYPLIQNPLLGTFSSSEVYAFCVLCGMIGLAALPWMAHSSSHKSSA